MKTYVITVQEILKRAILVNAESEKEALIAIQQKYRDQKIILDSDDFQPLPHLKTNPKIITTIYAVIFPSWKITTTDTARLNLL